MEEKVLGKISWAEFGTVKDFPFLFGLQLRFSMKGCGVGDGSKYTVNVEPSCKAWSTPKERTTTITQYMEKVDIILGEAGVNYVSELVGKPVEIVLENNTFKDFRILTEVL